MQSHAIALSSGLDPWQLRPDLRSGFLNRPSFQLFEHDEDDAFETCNVSFKAVYVVFEFQKFVHAAVILPEVDEVSPILCVSEYLTVSTFGIDVSGPHHR
jgi:hypothetical protein